MGTHLLFGDVAAMATDLDCHAIHRGDSVPVRKPGLHGSRHGTAVRTTPGSVIPVPRWIGKVSPVAVADAAHTWGWWRRRALHKEFYNTHRAYESCMRDWARKQDTLKQCRFNVVPALLGAHPPLWHAIADNNNCVLEWKVNSYNSLPFHCYKGIQQ